jgi:hypothetical protein
MGRSAEGRLGVDEPLLVRQGLCEKLEAVGIGELRCGTSAIEQALAVELPDSVEELAEEHGAQYWNGQQEQRMGGVYPALAVLRFINTLTTWGGEYCPEGLAFGSRNEDAPERILRATPSSDSQ